MIAVPLSRGLSYLDLVVECSPFQRPWQSSAAAWRSSARAGSSGLGSGVWCLGKLSEVGFTLS